MKRDKFYNSAESYHFFSAEGRERLHELLVELCRGNADACSEFCEMIWPWFERTRDRMASKILSPSDENAELAHDAGIDVLLACCAYAESNKPSWSKFNRRFQASLANKLIKIEAQRDRNKDWERLTLSPGCREPGYYRDLLQEAEFLRHLSEALLDLPALQREVFMQRYVEKIALEDVSLNLGRPERLIEKMGQEAKHKMRTSLEALQYGTFVPQNLKIRDLAKSIYEQKGLLRQHFGNRADAIKRECPSFINFDALTDMNQISAVLILRALNSEDHILKALESQGQENIDIKACKEILDQLRSLSERWRNKSLIVGQSEGPGENDPGVTQG